MTVSPRITVITPCLDQGRFLERCMDSVLDQGYPDLEYIVVDGGSTDASPDIIRARADRLAWWVSEPDAGQSAAINKALAGATGLVVNWLNADDFLEPGALDLVAQARAADPEAAAWVGGCRRLTPDLEELTVIHPNNLERDNLGHNWNGRQFYQPACFLNLGLVREAGGVNPDLEFCMDLELWLRLAELGPFVPGRGVWASAVVHEQAKTQDKRLEMHAETAAMLAAQGFPRGARLRLASGVRGEAGGFLIPPGLQQSLQGLDRCNQPVEHDLKGLKIAVASDYAPRFDASSSGHRVHGLVELMTGFGAEVDYFYCVPTPDDAAYARSLPRASFHLTGLDGATLGRELVRGDFDLVWLTNLWSPEFTAQALEAARTMRSHRPDTPVVADTMDFHAKKFLRRHRMSREVADLETARTFLALERELYPLCNAVVAVSEDEKRDILENIPNSAPVQVIANLHHVEMDTAPLDRREGLVFLGNFHVDHNLDAVAWLRSRVLPRILARRPRFCAHLLGQGSRDLPPELDHPALVPHGHVPDLGGALDARRVFVCPMTYGAGMKGKMGQAMAAGLPLVTTSVGAEGLDLVDGRDCFIADDAEEFATKCLHLYDDAVCWANFSLKARISLARTCGVREISRTLAGVLEPAAGMRRTR
jgi:GT2 family glycosyltransferase/glycosyltransferase involved in cell wall biosynthesis